MKNHTNVEDFLLLAFSGIPEIQIPLFIVFLTLYLSILIGNILIATVTKADSRLHTPMYFFISHLALMEICYTSVTIPKMLANILSKKNVIRYSGCVVQLYFFIAFGGIECILLAIMSYDRFVAICNPLCYAQIMSPGCCWTLLGSSWAIGFLHSILHTAYTFRLPFCSSNHIRQFFCDIPPLLNLACGDRKTSEIVLLVVGGLFGMGSFFLTLISYFQIISAIMKIQTKAGRHKTFSTCTSHLIVVSMFYGSALFMYLCPTSSYFREQEKIVSVFYAVVTPALNPIIYGLRSKELKGALWKMMHRKWGRNMKM